MKSIFLLISIGIASFGHAQSDEDTIDISQYLIVSPGITYVFDCVFTQRNTGERIEVQDTLILKERQNNGDSYFYYWENSPPYFSIFANSFIEGAFRIKNERYEYLPLDYEREVATTEKAPIELFPVQIKFETIYRSRSMSDDPVLYYFTNQDEDSIILLEKATKYETGTIAIDSIWLKMDLGVIRYLRSTGRNEVLTEHWRKQPKKIPKSGVIYTNDAGLQLNESELTRGDLLHSEFSTPLYDSDCKLLKETFFGTTGEMGVKYITYEYDGGLVVRELYHYTGRINPEAQVKYIWINEYSYYPSGNIKSIREKMNSNDDTYYREESYLDSEEHTLEEERFSSRHSLTCRDK